MGKATRVLQVMLSLLLAGVFTTHLAAQTMSSAADPGGTTDTSDFICYSYANRITPQANSGMGFTKVGYYGPCLLITPEEGFAGYTIRAVEPCMTFASDTVQREGELFIINKRTGKNIYSQQISLHFGYNYIPLDEEIKVSVFDSLLIGYKVWCEPAAQDLGIDYKTPPHAKGCYLWYSGGVMDMSKTKTANNWAMDVYLQAPQGVSTASRGKVEYLRANAFYATAGKSVKAYYYLHNMGSKDIKSITYKLSGVPKQPIEKTIDFDLPKGRRDTLFFEVVPEMSGDITLQILQLNGVDNDYASDQLKCGIILYDQPEGKPKRQHLLEYMTGEWCPFVGYGTEEIKSTLEAFEGTDTKVNLCAYHFDGDPFSTPETELYSTYRNSKAAPNLALNRIPYDITRLSYACEGYTIDRIKQLDQDTYSPYRFDFTLTPTENPMTFEAKVNIEELQHLNIEDLRITVSLFEDQVKPHDQLNPPKGYIHQNVYVRSLTDFVGDPIQFDSQKKFTKSYTVHVDTLYTGDLKNLKILAFIGRDLSNESLFSKTVLDSRMLSFDKWASVERPTTAADAYRVSVDHGCLQIEGGEYDQYEVWSLEGFRCDPCALQSGNYIVRVEHLGAYYIYKVIVP
ncbi:Omp28-related outer membrane protein [uncultured Porphyromonas sp.]|uniref:Omp28-related outer membrane protein n=1 Tax=uncultured Porphyromonas sp. TaxID=159274 RepID=UPI002625A85C|nr:Omp28-related outer membrane protein [uncultured Porphyromonas sp.]